MPIDSEQRSRPFLLRARDVLDGTPEGLLGRVALGTAAGYTQHPAALTAAIGLPAVYVGSLLHDSSSEARSQAYDAGKLMALSLLLGRLGKAYARYKW